MREDDQKECYENYGWKRNDYKTKQMCLYVEKNNKMDNKMDIVQKME